MKTRGYLFVCVLLTGIAAFAAPAAAHTPLFSCFDNGDGTIFCEGGFSDGSSAAGTPILVKDGSGAVLLKTELTRNSEVELEKPAGAYTVVFDGGDGHQIEISGSQIFE
ncbi:hypothetical protein [Desulfatitalea alkaliphila]|uniref:Nickel transport protein n=1 Tax=Desulfatitalea alkaliphila TaxID=2929485 RepID=A0AA41UHM8_9BACT|nr:hypothetical protein [Desulfatitalea alkaliphila]MCJ8499785.1 hypothetical protein [Desulfatitalea alkaliphila]